MFLYPCLFVIVQLPLLAGQDKWARMSQQCSGRSQSPINIDRENVNHDETLSISFKGYDRPIDGRKFKLTNNGHTVQLGLETSQLSAEEIPIIKGPALGNQSYQFAQLHFHWHSALDSGGSEHAIDGKRFALEVSCLSYLSRLLEFPLLSLSP